MNFFDKDLLLYLVIIVVFLAFFLWNRIQTTKNREQKKNRNFRNRYHEKRKNRRK
ncbi:hypothetical protein [Salinimicrobium soli]|uniref:hypothetical protein n=1 Tax=Salinimicrobium soli TaxID=1254399 RepID=UPI003AACE46E